MNKTETKMSKLNQRTECSGMEWKDFLFVIEALKRKGDFQFMLLISAGVYLGIRANEILHLNYEQLLHNDKFVIKERKTSKSRILTVNPALKELAEFALQKSSASVLEFISANKRGKPMSIQYFNRKLHLILRECNVVTQNFSSHVLRKTFGKIYYERNPSESSLILLSKVFNHSSPGVTRAYLGITQSDISNVFLSL